MENTASDNLEKEIRSLVAQILEIDEERVTQTANFVEDLGMDSMMALEILASLEKKYKVRIPEEYLTKVTNLSNITEIAKKMLEKK